MDTKKTSCVQKILDYLLNKLLTVLGSLVNIMWWWGGGEGATWSFYSSNTLKNHSSSRGDQKFPQIVAKFHIAFASLKKNINSEIQV